jgi:peptidoglycan L-alanyl-D-glutamate endopeptidase CwlK
MVAMTSVLTATISPIATNRRRENIRIFCVPAKERKPHNMDTISATRLATLHPKLQNLALQHIELCEAEGIEVRIVQAARTFEEQAALYAQGRTAPGAIVTHAQPGYGWHEFKLAYDLDPSLSGVGEAFNPDWNATHPVWKRMEAIGEGLGLYAGAEFRSFPDNPHFQLISDPVTPTDAMRAAYDAAGGGDAGIQAVWVLALPEAA